MPRWMLDRRQRGAMARAAEGEGSDVRSVREGIAGWLSALLPLIVANALGYLGLVDSAQALIAGAVAIVGGPLLGGGVVGWRSGRPQHGDPGGAAGALVAAVVAGGLYLISLLGLIVAAAEVGAEPELLAAHPIRVALAAICLACILAAVALSVAALIDRNAARRHLSPPMSPSRALTDRGAPATDRGPGASASVPRSLSQQTIAARRPGGSTPRRGPPSQDRDVRR